MTSFFSFHFLTHSNFPYSFGNFLVDLHDKPSEKSKKVSHFGVPVTDPFSLRREPKDSALQPKNNVVADGQRVNTKASSLLVKSPGKEFGKSVGNSPTFSDTMWKKDVCSHPNLVKTMKGREEQESEFYTDTDTTLPTEVKI